MAGITAWIRPTVRVMEPTSRDWRWLTFWLTTSVAARREKSAIPRCGPDAVAARRPAATIVETAVAILPRLSRVARRGRRQGGDDHFSGRADRATRGALYAGSAAADPQGRRAVGLGSFFSSRLGVHRGWRRPGCHRLPAGPAWPCDEHEARPGFAPSRRWALDDLVALCPPARRLGPEIAIVA